MKNRLSNSQICSNREEIIKLLYSAARFEDVNRIIPYLELSGFFRVPSSFHRHHNWEGGLAQHSLGVCKRALARNRGNIDRSSIIIAALLHDICKSGKYRIDGEGRFHYRHTHIKGHGYRSVRLLELKGFPLTEEQRLAIRWHMGGHHASFQERKDLQKARKSELWKLIHYSDKANANSNN